MTRKGKTIQNSGMLSHQRPIKILDKNDISKQKVTTMRSHFNMGKIANAEKNGYYLRCLNASELDCASLLFRIRFRKYPSKFEGLVYAEAADFRN